MGVGKNRGWAIWFVGLPGSGKSTLAKGVQTALLKKGVDAQLLQMDSRRKTYFPNPAYTKLEREQAYAILADEAISLTSNGINVILDGAAYKASMRQYARDHVEHFAEIFIKCDLQEAIRREEARPDGKVMAGLYKKALLRRDTGKTFEGLGEVIGVDVEFEQSSDAEFVIDNTHLGKSETLGKVLHFLDTWIDNA